MKIINEAAIDAVLEKVDTIQEDFEQYFEDFAEKQPVIIGFLDKENTSILSDDERDYMEYLVLVVYQAIEKSYKNIPEITEEQLGVAEEKNWEIMEAAKAPTFNDKLDAFFEDYPQEDLLAFIEDSLTEDAEDPDANMDFLTDDAREPMFVVLKSIIDAFHYAL
jgi:hypothetical protein